ncbi:MAG: lipopolysaccharide assembly protein LapA domain-containing protein [Terrimesophilobacter sp.]
MSSEHEGLSDPTSGESAGSASTDPAPDAPAPDLPAPDAQEQLQSMERQVQRTRISATWVAIIVAIVVLVLLLIFILDNLRKVTVTYFGVSGELPLGVALLFAAIGGAVLVAIVGVARLTQLKLNARRRRRASTQPRIKRTP